MQHLLYQIQTLEPYSGRQPSLITAHRGQKDLAYRCGNHDGGGARIGDGQVQCSYLDEARNVCAQQPIGWKVEGEALIARA
ncbi:hypothetical protein ABB26_07645 [Stenotrophomonas humi]|uniref:Uncharacterized protein n=1 Tax=Stenotrophomonas humi TaxID=405444 RepID=A0A0R0CFC4_9GAMM|nr:hypothetical protein ABB26_07645 [Stenotrophomonas humi]